MSLPRFTPRLWAALAAGLAVAAVAGLWLAAAPARNARAVAGAKVDAALSTARAASAAAAVDVVAAGAARDAGADRLTQENADAIRTAPGADQRLDPGLNRAGLVGLCRRAAYRGRPECLQFLGPDQPSAAGPRR